MTDDAYQMAHALVSIYYDGPEDRERLLDTLVSRCTGSREDLTSALDRAIEHHTASMAELDRLVDEEQAAAVRAEHDLTRTMHKDKSR